MESLEHILRNKAIPENTSRENTDILSNDEVSGELPACQFCHGARFVHPLLDDGRPDYSRIVPCRCVQGVLRGKRLSYLQQFSNLGALSRLTFDNLQPQGRPGKDPVYNFLPAYNAAQAYAEHPEGWLILVGANGCGKTHLACAIANQRLKKAEPVFYIVTADLLDHLRSTFQPNSDTEHDSLFDQIKNVPLLILDDLTMTVTTPWAKGKLEQLLNHRYNLQLPTVITTYVPIEEIDESIRGHLLDQDLCDVYLIGKSPSQAFKQLDGMELELLREMTFNNFDSRRMNLGSEKRENLEHAFKVARNFAECPQGWLVFLGENGCGKTHLSASIANHLRGKGESALFIVVPDLLDHLRAAFSPDSKSSYDSLFEIIRKAPVLILDDFGEQSTTPWAQEKLYQLINYRYNARLATVITTSWRLDDIEARISSRMVDPSLSLVFNIQAPDYRGDRGKKPKNAKTRTNYHGKSA